MGGSERILEFDVNKQRLTKKKSCDFSHIVAGSVGYLKTRFYFAESEWKGCRKAVSFWANDEETAAILDESDICDIPEEVLVNERFEVSVTGMRPGYRISTNKIKIRQEV